MKKLTAILILLATSTFAQEKPAQPEPKQNSLGAVSGAIIGGTIIGTSVAIESNRKFQPHSARQKKQETVGFGK